MDVRDNAPHRDKEPDASAAVVDWQVARWSKTTSSRLDERNFIWSQYCYWQQVQASRRLKCDHPKPE